MAEPILIHGRGGVTDGVGFIPPTGVTTYTVTGTTAGCTNTDTITITVNPLPVVTATPTSPTICTGNVTAIALTSNVTGTTFSWTATQTGLFGATLGSGSSIAQFLTILGTTAGTATYTVTPIAGGCSGTPITVVVTVNPLPTAIATPTSQTICSGNVTAIALTSNVSGATFSWTETQTAVSGASASSGSTIAQTLSTTGNTTGTALYTIIPSAYGCSGNQIIAAITVKPVPVVTATPASKTICSGNLTGIALTSNISSTTFSWTITQTGVSGASSGSGSSIAQTLSTTGTTAGTATYTVSSIAGGCSGTPVIVIVTVNPLPVATITASAMTLCLGTPDTLIANVTSGLSPFTYTWSPAGVPSITQDTTVITATTSGIKIWNLFVTDANNCSSIKDSVAVTVEVLPVVNLGLNITQCGSLTLNAGNAGSTYLWSDGSGNQTLTASSTSNYHVVVTNSCGSASDTVMVTIKNLPVITATPSSQTICSGTITGIALASNITSTTFFWTVTQTSGSGALSGSGSSIAQTLTATGATAGTAVYTIIPIANGCTGVFITVTVMINPIPVATAVPATQSTCSGILTGISLTSLVAGTTFSFTVVQNGVSGATPGSGNSIAQTIEVTGTTAGTATYTITHTAGGCSGTPIIAAITVNPLPVVTLSLNSDTVCLNTATFALTGGSPNGGTYSGNGVIAGNFDAGIAGAGNHTITYSYSDGNFCTNSASGLLFVDVCAGVKAIYDNSSIGIYPNPSSGIFTVTISGLGAESLEIYNVLGEKVYESHVSKLSSQLPVDLSNQVNGIYFIQIKSAKGFVNKKFCIRK